MAESAVGTPGWIHLAFFGGVIPWLVWRSRAKLARGHNPPRRRHFIAVMLQLLGFLGISVWVASSRGIVLFPPFELRPWPATAAAVLLAAGIALMAPRWRRSVERREPKVHLFMPRNGVERALWIAVSLAAAVAEEVTYRGVMYALLASLTGSALAGAMVAALVFGFSHLIQGVKSAAIITGIALALQALVAASGALYLAIGVHFLYDAVAGLRYGQLGEELGYPVDGIPVEADTPAAA